MCDFDCCGICLRAGKYRAILYRVDGAKQGNLCTAVCRKCKTQIIWAKMCIQSRRFVVYFRLVLHIHVVLVFTWKKSAGTAGKLDAESGCSSRDQSETAHCVWLTGKLQVRNGRRCTVLPEIHKRGDGKSGFLSLVCNRIGDRNCV